MQAFQIDNYGGPEALIPREVPAPVPGDGQIVLRIHATSFNPIDVKAASGVMRQVMPLTFPWTPGADFSGIVEAVGENVGDFTVGQEVYGYSPSGGAYAERIAVSAGIAAPKPTGLSHVEAASLALVVQTASQALEAAHLQPGQTILIQGAAGGVGSLALQLAHARGAHVIVTASEENAAALTALGADQVIDYKTTPFESVVKDVDVVLDTVGGDTQQRSFAVLKSGGCLVALSQPPSPEEAAKHSVHALMLQTQPSGANLNALAERLNAGDIRPNIGKVYPLADAATVWKDWSSLHIPGKIVFSVVP